MSTPLYNTDIIPMTSRPTLTVMDDGDYFVILDTSTGKISKILKTNIMTALKITYDNTTSELTAETVQAALDELADITDQAVKTNSTPSFNGIKFPATQVPSANPNTLDDYEEGTWTPTLIGSSSGTGTPAITSVADGKYNKIGNLVILRFAINCTDVSGLAGNLNIANMPFVGTLETNLRGVGSFYYTTGISLTAGMNQITLGVTQTNITILQGNGLSAPNIPVTQVANNSSFRGMAIYNV